MLNLSVLTCKLANCSLTFVFFGSLIFSMDAGAGVLRKANKPIPGQYIVLLKGEVPENEIDRQADRIAFSRNARIGEVWKRAAHGFVAQMSAADAAALANDPSVALVEEDGIMSISVTQSNPTWGLDRIDQSTLPLNSAYTYTVNGSGVRAYIIDTGILATHGDFGGRVINGYTAISDGRGTVDCNGHGTHVAGTVGGNTYGVAKGVNLVPVRVLGCSGSGSTSGVIAGVNWVTNQAYRPAVANMSLGGGASTALDTAIQNSINAGVTYVVAAGNNNRNACNYSPARVAAALTIGATTSSDARASYSNYGSCLDLFAPGSSVVSDYYTSNTATATLSGTSMASPHVAGAVALYLAANAGATPSQVATAINQNASTGQVSNSGTGSPNRSLYTGFIQDGPSDSTIPTAILTNPIPSLTLTGSVTLQANAADETGGSGVAKVEFFVDGGLVGTDLASPYTTDWNSASVPDGNHDVSATATDVAGNISIPSSVSITTVNGSSQPACSGSSQILSNPGFESGNVDWTASAGVVTNSSGAAAKTGSWKAWLNGYGTTHTDSLYQQVTIPADACSVTLKFWLWIMTNERTSAPANDNLVITVRDPAGALLATLSNYSNRDRTSTYQQRSFDLSAYKGQTISLQFVGTENRSRATHFLVDDAELMIVR